MYDPNDVTEEITVNEDTEANEEDVSYVDFGFEFINNN